MSEIKLDDADTRYRLHKACLHDEVVQIALCGFLCAEFSEIGVEIDGAIFAIALNRFSQAMNDAALIDRALAIVQRLREARAAETAEKRKHMN